MTEEMADIPQEGANPFNVESENDNSEAPPAEENETEETPAPEGENGNNQEDPHKDTPFHEHPRWNQREKEWEDRFNDQESRHQDDIKTLREDFKEARKDNAEQTEIPTWFGGDQAQWDAYRVDQDKKIVEAEDRAEKRIEKKDAANKKLVDDATNYMNSEIKYIQGDITLNPTGAKIDHNKLLKIVMDNDLIDSKGRWNYKAGFKIMNANVKKPDDNKKDRKVIGGISKESGIENKPALFKTNKDFEKERPW